MRKIKEILRLKWEHGLAARQIAHCLSISHTTVLDLLGRFQQSGLPWPLPDIDDAVFEARLYPGNPAPAQKRPEPDMAFIHHELQRKGVTLQLLWLEYKKAYPDGLQYSQFCDHYRQWCGKLDVVLRQHHRGGERMQVDFVGLTVPVVDPKTGEVRQAQIFVAVLPASNYTYAEAVWSQDLRTWITLHCHAFEFFEGVPEVVVPDNLRSGVTRACRYDPDLNPTYQEMAAYYGTVVIPARPNKPRDKGKVENAVQVVERWIMAPLRNRTFFSLHEVNQAIREALGELNNRPFQKLEGTRRTLYEKVDKPALRALPATRYEYAEWRKAKVNIDYHVEVDHNYYSVPHQFVRQDVDVRLTDGAVELLKNGKRIASHPRASGRGCFITQVQHRPAAHQKHLEWTPPRLVAWAESVGPQTGQLVRRILENKPHPEQGYRGCLGIMRLGKSYGQQRIEAAAARALASGACSYTSVKSILQRNLDQTPLPVSSAEPLPQPHQNLRGPSYYAEGGNKSC